MQDSETVEKIGAVYSFCDISLRAQRLFVPSVCLSFASNRSLRIRSSWMLPLPRWSLGRVMTELWDKFECDDEKGSSPRFSRQREWTGTDLHRLGPKT
jgi:hypothetical protein